MLSRVRSKAVVGSIALAFLVGVLGTPVAAHEGEHTGCSGPAHEMSAATRALHTAWRDARSELGSLERDVRSAFSELDRDARADLREVLSGAGRQVDHAARDARWAIRDVFAVELTACAEEGGVTAVPSPAKAEYDGIVAAAGELMKELVATARADAEALLANADRGGSDTDASEGSKDEDEQRAARAAERQAEKEKRLAEKQAEKAKRQAEREAERAKRQAEKDAERAKRLAERAERDSVGDDGDEDEDDDDEDEGDDDEDEVEDEAE